MMTRASSSTASSRSVSALYPYFVIRMLGGVLYLTGALIMVWNVWQTIRGRTRKEAPMGTTLAPAAA